MQEMIVVMRGIAEFAVVVKDCKNPTPYCYNGIATVLMPSSGSVPIWASDLDAGSFDNCTDEENLLFTFDEAGEEPSRVLTCDDLAGGPSLQIEVEVWVTDEAGNKDFCITYILLQVTNDSTCADISSLSSEGTRKDISGVTVTPGRKAQLANNPAFQGVRTNPQLGEMVLHQNRPNPYQQETIIEFELPASDRVTLQVMDISGRVLIQNTGDYSKGLHQWRLNKSDLGVNAGILYYQLTNNEQTLTKKMVIVE